MPGALTGLATHSKGYKRELKCLAGSDLSPILQQSSIILIRSKIKPRSVFFLVSPPAIFFLSLKMTMFSSVEAYHQNQGCATIIKNPTLTQKMQQRHQSADLTGRPQQLTVANRTSTALQLNQFRMARQSTNQLMYYLLKRASLA